MAGVTHVDQGWLSSAGEPDRFSEAVLVDFDPVIVGLGHLVEVHLHTHSCTAEHALRGRYRSAVYCFGDSQTAAARTAIGALQVDFERPIITEVVEVGAFRQNRERYRDYYRKHPDAPFCRRWIEPKLRRVEALGEP